MNCLTNTIVAMSDPFDYEEYKTKADDPVSRGMFYQAAGLYLGAKRESPEDVEKGHAAIIADMNKFFKDRIGKIPSLPETTPRQPAQPGCGGCGNGKT